MSSSRALRVCNTSGWRNSKMGISRIIPNQFDVVLNHIGAAQQKPSPHSLPGFVPPDRAAAHLHPPDGLLGAIIGPRHIFVPIEDPIGGPMFTQADEQIPQLTEGRKR